MRLADIEDLGFEIERRDLETEGSVGMAVIATPVSDLAYMLTDGGEIHSEATYPKDFLPDDFEEACDATLANGIATNLAHLELPDGVWDDATDD